MPPHYSIAMSSVAKSFLSKFLEFYSPAMLDTKPTSILHLNQVNVILPSSVTMKHKQPLLRNIKMHIKSIACAAIFMISSTSASAQAWKNCIPNSIGPGGCDSIGPGGGKSIGPGGGQSIGPGGGKSIGPGGGQSIGPGGGQSIGPNGGQSINRNRKTGLNPNTLRPYTCSEGGPC